MRRRSSCAALLIGAVVLAPTVAACAGVSGTATSATWGSSHGVGVLSSITATAESRYSVSLVDVAALNRIDKFAEQPLSTTAEDSSGRPPAESAWSRYALSSASCTAVLESGPFSVGASVRSGPLSETVNVGFGDFDTPDLLSVCQGPVDSVPLPAVLEEGATPTEIAGVPGVQTDEFWVGFQPDEPRTTMIGDDVPRTAADAVLTSTSVPDSLAADAGVRAVLTAAPRAATIEMGTFLLGLGSIAMGDPEVGAAVSSAQEQVGGVLPAPVFAGFGWTPGAEFDGTATFVTVYASEDDARAAGAVLTDTWPRLTAAPGSLATATTAINGAVVVTEIADVPPDRYDLRTLRIADYPGWGAG